MLPRTTSHTASRSGRSRTSQQPAQRQQLPQVHLHEPSNRNPSAMASTHHKYHVLPSSSSSSLTGSRRPPRPNARSSLVSKLWRKKDPAPVTGLVMEGEGNTIATYNSEMEEHIARNDPASSAEVSLGRPPLRRTKSKCDDSNGNSLQLERRSASTTSLSTIGQPRSPDKVIDLTDMENSSASTPHLILNEKEIFDDIFHHRSNGSHNENSCCERSGPVDVDELDNGPIDVDSLLDAEEDAWTMLYDSSSSSSSSHGPADCVELEARMPPLLERTLSADSQCQIEDDDLGNVELVYNGPVDVDEFYVSPTPSQEDIGPVDVDDYILAVKTCQAQDDPCEDERARQAEEEDREAVDCDDDSNSSGLCFVHDAVIDEVDFSRLLISYEQGFEPHDVYATFPKPEARKKHVHSTAATGLTQKTPVCAQLYSEQSKSAAFESQRLHAGQSHPAKRTLELPRIATNGVCTDKVMAVGLNKLSAESAVKAICPICQGKSCAPGQFCV